MIAEADLVERAGAPAGFAPLKLGGGFGSANGAFFWRREGEGTIFGTRIEERHCSPTGKCHGGWLATFCDMVLPLSCRFAIPEYEERFLLTVNLSLDYLAPVSAGDWLEGRCVVLKQTKRMVFVQGVLTVDADPVLRASGVFRAGPPAAALR